jgi:FMN phosphatase YigB (HAD superfamily)
MEKIRAVIFDWGGVLIEDPAPGSFKYCAKALGVSEEQYRIAFNICMNDFQTGRVTEQQFWQNMTNHLNARLGGLSGVVPMSCIGTKSEAGRRSRVPMPKAGSLWGEAFAAVYAPRQELFALADRLHKAGYKTAILSNTEKPTVELIHKQKYDAFDVAVFSCLEGITKPDRKIYEITLDRLGTSPAQTLFIDDRQDFIDGAKQVGLQTILFENVRQLRKELGRFCPDTK